MPKKRPKSVKSPPPPPPPQYGGTSKYIYVARAKLLEGINIVKREKWKTGHYHLAARNIIGQFVATKRWKNKPDTKKFADKYGYNGRTLTISSPKKYNMTSEINKKMIFSKMRKKYSKYNFEISSFEFRYIYNANNGQKVLD
jgi:hypothetical protein